VSIMRIGFARRWKLSAVAANARGDARRGLGSGWPRRDGASCERPNPMVLN